MAEDHTEQIDKLRKALAALEAQQRDLGLDHTAHITELQRRLGEMQNISQSGTGAVATTGGVAGGAHSTVVGRDVAGSSLLPIRAPQWSSVSNLLP